MKIKSSSPNGRILYDARSILKSDNAQRHIKSSERYFKKEVEMSEKQEENIVEVSTTSQGYTIFRVPNKEIGGYDYLSDSIAGGWRPVGAECSIEELEVILADMKKVALAEENIDIMNQPQPFQDVHTEHCCINCGCKYSNDHKDCPVISKTSRQSYKCTGECYKW